MISSIPVLGSLFKSKIENKNNTELVMLVTPEVTEALGPNDPKPTPYFPRDFLKRIEPKDVPAGKSGRSKRRVSEVESAGNRNRELPW